MMKKLEAMGVKTARDYASLPETTVRMLFHLPGYRTWKELKGIPCIALEDMIEPRKSICVSRSFSMVVFAITNRFKQDAPQIYASKYVWYRRKASPIPFSLTGRHWKRSRDCQRASAPSTRLSVAARSFWAPRGSGEIKMSRDHQSPAISSRPVPPIRKGPSTSPPTLS